MAGQARRAAPENGERTNLAQYLNQAEAVILNRRTSETATPAVIPAGTRLRVGVDLGTAYLVMVVLDEAGLPLAGEWQYAEVARDGLVVDFIAAVDLLRGMKARLETRMERKLDHAASGFPPGVPAAERRATANVLEAAGLTCSGLIDEPSAANHVLRLREGAIVDVGGGTTGIAVLEDGRVIYTADEATGGTHFTLVIAGALGISYAEAEAMKVDPHNQPRLLPVVTPVMEKVAEITRRHIAGRNVSQVTLVGGCSAFMGMAETVQNYIGISTQTVSQPLFVTPLGLALADLPQ